MEGFLDRWNTCLGGSPPPVSESGSCLYEAITSEGGVRYLHLEQVAGGLSWSVEPLGRKALRRPRCVLSKGKQLELDRKLIALTAWLMQKCGAENSLVGESCEREFRFTSSRRLSANTTKTR